MPPMVSHPRVDTPGLSCHTEDMAEDRAGKWTTDYYGARYSVVDAVTFRRVEHFPTFATWQEARDACGANWVPTEHDGRPE